MEGVWGRLARNLIGRPAGNVRDDTRRNLVSCSKAPHLTENQRNDVKIDGWPPSSLGSSSVLKAATSYSQPEMIVISDGTSTVGRRRA